METKKPQKCYFCQQVDKKNCCVWRLYYRKYKKQDFESENFNIFAQEEVAKLYM